MEPICTIAQELIEDGRYSQESLAEKLGVAPSTVSRWVTGTATPRPTIEGLLRELHRDLHSPPSYITLPLLKDESSIRGAVDTTLQKLREILHRRGRLSSRNEALDELSKLLFAHVMSLSSGQRGISRDSVLGDGNTESSAAVCLGQFVSNVFSRYLPKSLSHEMSSKDFELNIKPQESTLALEIIHCFESFTLGNEPESLGDLGATDMLNDVFGRFLTGSFADEKQLGQYLTPTEVVKFMVQLAIDEMTCEERQLICDPESCNQFGLILDPSCGVASFLTETIRTLYQTVASSPDRSRKWLENMVNNVIVGIDKSERMIRLALTSMAMFGLPASKLHLANSLARFGQDSELTDSLEGKVGLILTNPPFGAEFEGKDLSRYKLASDWSESKPAKVDSELLFMERYLNWLAPGGQLLAIVPDSILTNRGLYGALRRGIAGDIGIRSVVSLPAVTFGAAGTNTKTSVLHLRKRGPRVEPRPTFFAICQDVGFSVTTREALKTKVASGKGDLPGILDEYSLPDSGLLMSRRVGGVAESARWDATFHASLPQGIEQRLKEPLSSDVVLSSVAELSQERVDPRRWGAGTFQYIEISDVDPQTLVVHPNEVECAGAPSRARKIVRSGDVLFSTVRPERRTIGVVQEDQAGAICTTGFAVVRPKGIDSFLLAHLLRSDFVISQVMRNNIGIAYPAINEECLMNILLPVRQEDLDIMNRRSEVVLAIQKELRLMRQDFEQGVAELIEVWARSA